MFDMAKLRRVLVGMPAMAVLALAACTVVVDEPPRPGPGPGPRPEPQFCTREYDPVCGRRDGERRTFSNACEAESAGYRVIGRGECRRRGDDRDDRPRACTNEYRPVCARQRGEFRTFGNACAAEAQGWRVVSDRPC